MNENITRLGNSVSRQVWWKKAFKKTKKL